MLVLSHRGYWLEPAEKNSQQAFERSFRLGFGTETDIRDHDGRLVISHDPASADAMPLSRFLEIYTSYPTRPPLALNIKSDGLQLPLKTALQHYAVDNCFVFDMAVPDALGYLRHGFCTFTRHSEYEPLPAYYAEANGVWLDAFDDEWLDLAVLQKHLQAGKRVCIVSPELHGRPHEAAWQLYRTLALQLDGGQIMLCTDLPEAAQEFFHV